MLIDGRYTIRESLTEVVKRYSVVYSLRHSMRICKRKRGSNNLE
jgi:hypothetical protein